MSSVVANICTFKHEWHNMLPKLWVTSGCVFERHSLVDMGRILSRFPLTINFGLLHEVPETRLRILGALRGCGGGRLTNLILRLCQISWKVRLWTSYELLCTIDWNRFWTSRLCIFVNVAVHMCIYAGLSPYGFSSSQLSSRSSSLTDQFFITYRSTLPIKI